MEVVIIMGLVSLILGGCTSGSGGAGKRAKDNESGIQKFEFLESGSNRADIYSYTVENTGEGIVLSYESLYKEAYGTLTRQCTQELLDSLNTLYKSYRLAEWDGYDKVSKNVLDGDSFTLKIKFNDGESLYAHGYASTPDRYGDFFSDMRGLLDPIRDEALEEKRQEIIAGGIKGTLDLFSLNIIQHGTSGKDEYRIIIRNDSIAEKNFDVTIKSVSGEYFEKGETKYYLHIPNEELGLDELRKIVDDLSVIEWYDYEKSAEDYNNAEWFQLGLGFDSGMYISALGTEHPERYEEFRALVLSWLRSKLASVPAG
jgi:hypothetical protein